MRAHEPDLYGRIARIAPPDWVELYTEQRERFTRPYPTVQAVLT